MSRKDRHIISLIRHIAKSNVPPDGRVLLYGSRARGTAREDSDWDLLIILNKAAIEQSDYDNISYLFFISGLEEGQLFSPVLYTKKEWEEREMSLFHYNVDKDGIIIQ